MPINKTYKAPFEHEVSFHVYNKSVYGQQLFYEDENYRYFLTLFYKYLGNLVDVRSWVLMPNHFHFHFRVKSYEKCVFDEKDLVLLGQKEKGINAVFVRRFKNFFISYSKALKKRFSIKTNVFAQKFKHKKIFTDEQETNLMYYIHHNPLHHKLTDDWEHYKWSSYKRILDNSFEGLDIDFILDWFGSIDIFRKSHLLNSEKYFEEFD
ncbi:MAG: hypothetical protein IPP79_16665 [Chitinophagaceae bacterium]|nr:hypothetical protein [Chitinophagaceae bacterium]